MTHAQGDRWDVYEERVRRVQSPTTTANSGAASQAEALFRGEWCPIQRLDEEYFVRGESEPRRHPIWLTRHGPIIGGDPLQDEVVLAAQWGLAQVDGRMDPTRDMDAILAVLRSKTAREAQEGFRSYHSISGNFCCADLQGDIAYQYSGRIPRRPCHLLPVPGWDGEHEWDTAVPWIPQSDLPCEVRSISSSSSSSMFALN
jgi:penicillin amidase